MEKLVCTECGKSFEPESKIWRCDCSDTGLLNLEFTPLFCRGKYGNREASMWRYREAFPINDNVNIVTLGEGFTPLLKIEINDFPIYVKQEQLSPSGSFKDRGASVLISKMCELGINEIVLDSSGNTGCAVAAYSAKAGIKCTVYLPSYATGKKVSQIMSYGAKIIKVNGSRDETASAALSAAEFRFYAAHYRYPYFFHGVKTIAYEISEQLDWRAPDKVILPVGSGSLLIGVYTGFTELYNAGLIKSIPQIIGVQPSNCAPVYKAYLNRLSNIPSISTAPTIAEGMAITNPLRGIEILQAIRRTEGKMLSVTEEEIRIALEWAFSLGYCIEPSSAVVIAVVKQLVEQFNENELITTVFTGSGLKTLPDVI